MKPASLFSLIIGLNFLYFASYSQGWEKSYGGSKNDMAYDVIKTSDGCFVAVGSTESFGAGGTDVFVVKINNAGNLVWSRVIGGTGNDIAYSVSETTAGELVIAGATSSFGAGGSDVYVLKLSANGTTQWTRTFGGTFNDEGRSVIVSGGDIYVAGSKSWSYFDNDFYLIKISSIGYPIWEKTYSTPGSYSYDRAYCMVKTFDGGFALAGKPDCCNQVYLVKTDANGQVLFTKSFDQPSDFGATGIVETANHNLVMTGVNNRGGNHPFLIKVNSAGNLVYNRVTSALVNSVTNLAIANNGNLLLGADVCNLGCTMELIKYDGTGAELWRNSDYQLANYTPYSYTFSGVKAVKVISGDSYIACGSTRLPSGSQSDFLIVKTDSSGNTYSHPVLSYSGPTVFCDSDSVTITAPSGYTSYQWTYVDTDHHLDYIDGANTPLYTAKSTGYYSCIMKSATNDVNVAFADYVIKSSAPVITLKGHASFCTAAGETLQLTTGQEPGSSYHWELNETIISGATDTSYSPTVSGNYTVVQTNLCGTIGSVPIVVNVNEPPETPVILIDNYLEETQCMGITDTSYNEGNLRVKAVTGATYQWCHNGIIIDGATDRTTFPYFNDDDYTCTVTTACGSATSVPRSGKHRVNNEGRAFVHASGPVTGCGVASVTLSIDPYMEPYHWYKNDSIIPGATDASYLVTSSGDYYCKYEGQVCGRLRSRIKHVDITSDPTPSITASGPIFVCTGPMTLNAAPVGAGISYEWYMDSVVIPGATASSYDVSSSGNYKCLVTQPCGSLYTIAVYVSIGLPSNTITADTTNFCSASSAQLSVSNPEIGESYRWKCNGVNVLGGTSADYNTHTPGTYTCNITNSCGTVTSNAITINRVQGPLPVITGNTKFCAGTTNTLTENSGTAISWNWYRNNSPIGINQQSIPATYSGDFKVLVTDVNGCTAFSNVFTTTYVSKPVASITFSEYPDICSGDSITMTTNSANDYVYHWKKNKVNIAGANSNSYTTADPGNYTVKVTNMCGTTAAHAQPKVRVKSLPSANITPQGPVSFCNGDSVVLTADSGADYEYSWKRGEIIIYGETGSSYNATIAGEYKVVVTGHNGCSNVSAATIVTVPCKEIENISADAADDFKFSVYPNPATDKIFIKFNMIQCAELRIFDVVGACVLKREAMNGSIAIDISGLSKGMYTVQLTAADGVQNQKLLKQ